MTSITTIIIAIVAGLVFGFIAGWTICDARAMFVAWPAATPRQVRRAQKRNRADLRAIRGGRS
jgi:hypothetical protein